ncbi:ATP-dependent DNA helicase DDX11 [Brevipalpus obovatus]|uniref:ATP-dependent DNA helicase DDX11 n=1 Tax=Brevipalpus obovatus TaxID=246614 RepID=UPI003D9F1AE0
MEKSTSLSTTNFGQLYPYNFPYEPYNIQIELMQKIEQALEEEKIGIFSSPTGTGKSLSIICSTFNFIEKNLEQEELELRTKICDAEKALEDINNNEKANDLGWVSLHSKKRDVCENIMQLKSDLEKYQKFHERNTEIRTKIENRISLKSNKDIGSHKSKKTKGEEDDDTQLVSDLDDVVLDDDVADESDESKETFNPEENMGSAITPKIIYSSRTHSQLAQFVNEVKRTVYGRRVRVVTLGSRSNLCVNPAVNKLKHSSQINDKCTEMQRSSSNKCPYANRLGMQDLRDDILGITQDIEEISILGSRTKACSYFASRMAAKEAQVIVVPYNILLHKQTRESLGLKLEQNIVIIDEAHNLLDTIASIHSAQVNGGQIIDTFSQLNQYMIKYNKRLSPRNLMMVKQLQSLLRCFVKLIQEKSEKASQHEIFSPTELLVKIGAEDLNVFQILDFCEKSQIARKLFGFSTIMQTDRKVSENSPETVNGTLAFLAKLKQNKQDPKKIKKPPKKKKPSQIEPEKAQENESTSLGSPLYALIELFRCLTSPLGEGRILLTRNLDEVRSSTLKFILLDPANQFREIVEKTRSLILIGGTMEPVSEFFDLLFLPLGISPKNMINFSCNHVIPDENIMPICLARGPKGKSPLEFTFKTRGDPELLRNVGELLIDLLPHIPGGVILFFPSYEYERTFYEFFKKNGILSKLESGSKKKIFREPKNSNQINKLLSEYSRAIDDMVKERSRGAILLSVVGGKMSEGINFSDDMCRCVIMIGLPYANLFSPELKEKMSFLASRKEGLDQVYYENLCLKAVNQSIGRAIRHRSDYASIILLDRRYCDKQSIQDNLPKWIQTRLKVTPHYDSATCLVQKFFSAKARKNSSTT